MSPLKRSVAPIFRVAEIDTVVLSFVGVGVGGLGFGRGLSGSVIGQATAMSEKATSRRRVERFMTQI